MQDAIHALQNYLLGILDIKIKLSPWNNKSKLPFFLGDSYDFYEGVLLKQKCLFAIDKETGETTPATIKKHFEQIQKQSGEVCVLVQMTTTSYNRKRLIERHISFIIPGNQMYLPELGIDLREYFKAIKERKKILSPATQAVLINALLTKNSNAVTPSELSAKISYTTMTMSRAFDELENADIGKVSREGKERLLIFEESTTELWEKTKHLMRDPVKRRVWAKGKKPNLLAGLSALAQVTMLAPPVIPVYAVGHEEWEIMNVTEVPDQEEAAFEVEIWHYNPALLAKNSLADPYSLYLSLRGTEDERVEAALELMMGRIK